MKPVNLNSTLGFKTEQLFYDHSKDQLSKYINGILYCSIYGQIYDQLRIKLYMQLFTQLDNQTKNSLLQNKDLL